MLNAEKDLYISEFLNKVQERDLILIDELGTGTDPNDGESLAVAICKFLNQTGCKSIITSHFDGMKQYSFTDKRILCGSMIFDEQNMMPHYKLQIGIPGKSYGILIAKKYGIDEDIIDFANKYLSGLKDASNDEYILRLNQEISEVQKLKEELEFKTADLEKKLQVAKNNNEILQKKLENFNKETNEIRNEIIEETKEQIEDIKRQLIKNPNLKLHDLIAFEGNLNEIKVVEEPEDEEIETFNIGDYIRDTSFGIEGKIISLKKEKVEIVTDGGQRYTLTLTPKLKKVQRKVEKKKPISNGDFLINVGGLKIECNLIGMHVDEALNELDRYMDKAVLAKKERIRIIHGYGTGALRRAVHEYLAKHKHVKSYKLGGEFDGGLGSTIAFLK